MKRFFKKLFKRGDFMTRSDKAYYSHKFKTVFWSVFSMFIISWVGTNLVLCALTTNVESNWDIIYEVPRDDVFLPTGQELCATIKGYTNVKNYKLDNNKIKTITFGYLDKYSNLIDGVSPEIINADDKIFLYRLNNGADIYILSINNMFANEESDRAFYGFRSLEKITFENFDTSRTLDMEFMFGNTIIASLDLSVFNTSNVTVISSMFYLSGIKTLDLSSFDTSSVKKIQGMFGLCSELETIYVSDLWNLSNVDYSKDYMYAYVFNECSKLVGGEGTKCYGALSKTDYVYARIDDPDNGKPGYFTYKPYSGK